MRLAPEMKTKSMKEVNWVVWMMAAIEMKNTALNWITKVIDWKQFLTRIASIIQFRIQPSRSKWIVFWNVIEEKNETLLCGYRQAFIPLI